MLNTFMYEHVLVCARSTHHANMIRPDPLREITINATYILHVYKHTRQLTAADMSPGQPDSPRNLVLYGFTEWGTASPFSPPPPATTLTHIHFVSIFMWQSPKQHSVNKTNRKFADTRANIVADDVQVGAGGHFGTNGSQTPAAKIR